MSRAPHLTLLQGGQIDPVLKDARLAAARADLLKRNGQVPTAQDTMEHALGAQLARLYRRWELDGSPGGAEPD